MACIYFVGTYNPIMCGIADYTGFLTRHCPEGKWGVISFDLKRYGAPLINKNGATTRPVWYGIPGYQNISASTIREGLSQFGVTNGDTVLWFQHETAIWANPQKFVETLRHLNLPKIVTFHTLHFQRTETPSGLKADQHALLHDLLPHVDAITVFSHGVYYAVTSAFPEHQDKVHVLRHGVEINPEVMRLSRREARGKLLHFLLHDSTLDPAIKQALAQQHVLSDDSITLLGETGFLCPSKQSERLFSLRDTLSKMIPDKPIVALRIGGARQDSQKAYAHSLREASDNCAKFMVETWLPQDMLPIAQRAFDINFYWPQSCTQSGVVAHALGAGAIIAGRDMEGTGEILRESGQIVDVDLRHLAEKIRSHILNPEDRGHMEENARQYAAQYSWRNQAFRHYDMADRILHPMPLWTTAYTQKSGLQINHRATPKTETAIISQPFSNRNQDTGRWPSTDR